MLAVTRLLILPISDPGSRTGHPGCLTFPVSTQATQVATTRVAASLRLDLVPIPLSCALTSHHDNAQQGTAFRRYQRLPNPWYCGHGTVRVTASLVLLPFYSHVGNRQQYHYRETSRVGLLEYTCRHSEPLRVRRIGQSLSSNWGQPGDGELEGEAGAAPALLALNPYILPQPWYLTARARTLRSCTVAPIPGLRATPYAHAQPRTSLQPLRTSYSCGHFALRAHSAPGPRSKPSQPTSLNPGPDWLGLPRF